MYADTSLADATVLVATRLLDPTFLRWSQAELGRYVVEALRVWQGLTAQFKDVAVFPTVQNQAFYDLQAVAPALRPLTVLDTDLVLEIQDHLLEPESRTTWPGSLQFTLPMVLTAIQRRRDQFLTETATVVTQVTDTIAPPPDGRIFLPDAILRVERAAWQSTDGTVRPLLRTDEWGLNHYARPWVQAPARPPRRYSVGVTPPLEIQVQPVPQDTGVLSLLAIQTGPIPIAGRSALLGVPDDWAWVVKWGALADLLAQEGLTRDTPRSQYCEERWRLGVDAAKTAPVVLTARIDNQVIPLGTVADADRYSVAWQNVSGTPRRVLTAGQTLVALWPPPALSVAPGPFSVTLDLVVNCPVPVLNDQGFLPTDPGALDPVLSYAQHLALFKEGPGQLDQSIGLLDRFLKAAGAQTFSQSARIPARAPLLAQTTVETRAVPKELPVGA
jgi:hypothetical protein